MSTKPNSPAAAALTWGPTEVYAAAGVARGVAHSWIARQLIPLPPGPGMGRERRFSLLDAIAIAVVAELSRLGVSIGIASHGATLLHRLQDEGKLVPLDEPGWTLVLVPTSWPLNSVGDHRHPLPLSLIKYETLGDLHAHVAKHHSDPESFALVDVSRVAKRVRERLTSGIRIESKWDDTPTGEKVSVVVEPPSVAAPTTNRKRRIKAR